MEKTFTAIDFETAQGYRNSICQVGLVRVEKGNVVKEMSVLVRPPDNYYWKMMTDIHGLTWRDTADSPVFVEVWPQIASFIEGQVVVAHNGFKFDFDVLKKTLLFYGIKEPEYEKRCTLRIYGKGLAPLCEMYGIPLDHHNALSDARACADLYIRYINKLLKKDEK